MGRAARSAAYVVAWLLLAVALGVGFFLASSRSLVLAGHDAVVRPDLSGDVVVRTGPVLPDLRLPAGGRVGVDVTLGKTDAASLQELVQRYALLATRPEAQRARVAEVVTDLALDAALRGGALALLPVAAFALVGATRRRELWLRARGPRGVAAVLAVGLVAVALAQPWQGSDRDAVRAESDWQPLGDFVGADVPLPAEAAGIEVSSDVFSTQTRRLVESAVDTYDKSQSFYDAAAADAAELDLRVPADDETVVTLVSDRHDNIGMDGVARAIGDRAGATAVYDAGDDTSTGSSYEAFSLDSLDAAFDGVDDRWAVPGNHDNGTFVGRYLAETGWDVLDGEVVDGPGGSRLLGAPDPRASGLGSWRDETGLTFGDVEGRIADTACRADEEGDRVTTVLVHDANLGREALARGCTDLVVGGHTHVRSGPTAVTGENGATGWSYTTGTTGGAAYAIALGSKPRRPAEVSLVTYREGRPVGIESVVLQTDGSFTVVPWTELVYDDAGSSSDPSDPSAGSSAVSSIGAVSASSGRETSTVAR